MQACDMLYRPYMALLCYSYCRDELERLRKEHAAAEEERVRKEEQLTLTHERKVLEMERLERHMQVRVCLHLV